MAIVATRLRLPDRRIAARASTCPARALLDRRASRCFVLLATLGGHDLPWRSAGTIALAVGGVAARRRASSRASGGRREPVLPLRLFADPVMRAVGRHQLHQRAAALVRAVLRARCSCRRCRGPARRARAWCWCRSCSAPRPARWVTGRLVARTGRYRAWPITGSVLMTVAVAAAALPRPRLARGRGRRHRPPARAPARAS